MDVSMLESQLKFIYMDTDFHKETSMAILQYIFQLNIQSSLPEVVKLLKMNGVFSLTSASAERSFSCLKRVKTYLRGNHDPRLPEFPLPDIHPQRHLKEKEG